MYNLNYLNKEMEVKYYFVTYLEEVRPTRNLQIIDLSKDMKNSAYEAVFQVGSCECGENDRRRFWQLCCTIS